MGFRREFRRPVRFGGRAEGDLSSIGVWGIIKKKTGERAHAVLSREGSAMGQVKKLGVVPAELDIDFHHGPYPTKLPRRLAVALERALEPDEEVVWLGRPETMAFVSRSLGNFLPGIPILAFAVVVLYLSTANARDARTGAPTPGNWFVLVWCTAVALIGVRCLLSPLFAWRLARRSLYVVSDRRAILIEALWSRRIQSFAGERLLNATRNEDRYGRGDIILERLTVQNAKGRSSIVETGFIGLDDVKRVEQLMRATVARGGGGDVKLPEFLRKYY